MRNKESTLPGLIFYLFILLAEYAGHAQSMMKSFDLSSVDAVIIASGDGLLYEVSVCACVRLCKI